MRNNITQRYIQNLYGKCPQAVEKIKATISGQATHFIYDINSN